MRCFNHPQSEAVGLCKSCSKGLCSACAADLDHGLACKGKHEEAVQILNGLVARSAKVYSVTPKSRFIAPLFYGFMGLIFALPHGHWLLGLCSRHILLQSQCLRHRSGPTRRSSRRPRLRRARGLARALDP